MAFRLNKVSEAVINSIFLGSFFSITKRVVQRLSDIYESFDDELEAWALRVDIQLKLYISTIIARRRVLLLIYRYRHLDGANLNTLLTTDLIQHRIRLVEDIKPTGSRS